MKIIALSEEMGLIWYTASDYKRREIHVVCYGLEVKQFNSHEQAQEQWRACMGHHWEWKGAE